MAKEIQNVAITVSIDITGNIEFQASNGKYVYDDTDSGWCGDQDFDGEDEIVGDTHRQFKSQEKALRWLVKGVEKSKSNG